MHLVARPADASAFATVSRLCNLERTTIASFQAEIWKTMWEAASPFGVVISDLTDNGACQDVAVAIATFVNDWAKDLLVSSEVPYALQHLSRQVRLNKSPFVKPSEVGSANARDGLNLLVCYMGWSNKTENSSGLRAVLLNAFADRHGGNRLQSLVGETCDRSLRTIARRTGLSVLNAYGLKLSELTEVHEPHPCLMGITRDDALARENHWLNRMFSYFPPKLFFTEPQRQILLLAREGFTDNEIAGQLGVNADAVKKRWVAIYERVSEVFPDLLPNSPTSGRGSEKRRILLARLKDRPEELRPFDRKAAG